MNHQPDKRQIADAKREATDWWVRLDGGNLDQRQYQAFQAWLHSDPSHAIAFAEIERLWGELDAIKPPIPSTIGPSGKPIAPHLSAWFHALGTPRFFRWPTAMALGCLLFWLSPLSVFLRADFQTGIGEMRTIRLSDGSKVHLNSDSAFSVVMKANARQIELLKGEALFEVDADPGRPFRVHAGNGTVTALGTAFNIRLTGNDTQVTVTEHSVAIKLDDRDETSKLDEGQTLAYGSPLGMGKAQITDTHAVTAWQRGKLVFENKPLGEVIAELNRYHRGYLMIGDAGIAERRVNGVFRTDDTLAVVNALQASLHINSTRINDYLILLHR